MVKKFNLTRYKELLKLDPISLSDADDIFLEFLGYEASIGSQICYNRKEEYFSLINKYLIGILTPYQFRSKFLKMESEHWEKVPAISENFEALEIFTLADDLENFSHLKIQIWTLCYEFAEILDDGRGKRMTEIEFYSLVNRNYFQLQRFFPLLSTSNLPYQKLVDRSFKILKWILGSEIVLVLFYFNPNL